jgi:hypothetical protein
MIVWISRRPWEKQDVGVMATLCDGSASYCSSKDSIPHASHARKTPRTPRTQMHEDGITLPEQDMIKCTIQYSSDP